MVYHEKIRNEVLKYQPNIRWREERLYARVTWIHNIHAPGDADNISKPLLDALTSVVYTDDLQVAQRLAIKIDGRDDFAVSGLVKAAGDDNGILLALSDAINNKEDQIVFVEVGELLAQPTVTIGPIESRGTENG